MTLTPTGTIHSALERAVARLPLGVDDAETLLDASGDDLERVFDLASQLRDEGLVAAGRPGVITFSKKVFLPITTLCRDRCHYCIFVDTPGKLAKMGKALYMSPEQILQVARQGAAMGCKEALFTLGDRPEERWPDARAWLDEHGYESTLHYVHEMAELVLRETGLLPHMNPGVMSAAEMAVLRPVAPSMGMMLETTAHRLWADKGEVHYGSPDKEPAVRLKVLEDAGEMRIPLTTGILVGIGENLRERAESIVAIRESHARHGQVQETIIQNFRAKPATAMQNEPDFGGAEYAVTVAVARLVLGSHSRIQVPPNLSDASELRMLVRAGIDDWGGISPLTADHVNPERPWPELGDLADMTRAAGFELRERLTVHPSYIRDRNEWIDPALHAQVLALTDPTTGLADESAHPFSVPTGAGPKTAHRPLSFSVRTSDIRSSLLHAENEPAHLSDAEYAALLRAEGDDLDTLTALASGLRRYTVGEAVSFVVNRNVTSTHLGQGTAAGLTLGTLGGIVDDAWSLGATELCVQGIIGPTLPATSYLDLARAVKAAQPNMHLHAFRPADIADGAARMGLDDTDYLTALLEAGVDTIPGTGVKMLRDSIRARVAPADLPVDRWTAIITAAHRAGLRSTSVMVYGNGESALDRVAHLRSLRAIQSETGGFTEFVPMPVPGHPLVDGRSDLDEHRAVHAVSRLVLHGYINHLQVPWTRLGFDTAATMLQSGADDLGGTLLDGAVLPEVGIEHGKVMTLADVTRLARSISRPVRQRTTGYGEPTTERKSAARA
ncbi:7,8-didemethyl-8-hydroxy-5-deazariboflavin synthase CofG [Cryobacterium sp. TMS1-13-1]|uniref:7,8-didemethyl-8-hydroxy-5-deazariboflavin synthase CofG n=1 Tax=Cryobacterium sp. TMS1-13-1 TaxID=1259220 RepID=UPI001F53EE4A|nr:7,8-didemethyl-8-hydroxy-5-deazariboflavin synthase CofG [Cryobacterium sp. TMS1-13-1]